MGGCAAVNCNTLSGKGVSLYSFPANPSRRRLWINKVRRKDFNPSTHARLCEKHFTDESFKVSRTFARSLGYDLKRPQLKEDAVPLLFDYNNYTIKDRKKTRSSLAMEKRRRMEVCSATNSNTNLYEYICTLIIFIIPS